MITLPTSLQCPPVGARVGTLGPGDDVPEVPVRAVDVGPGAATWGEDDDVPVERSTTTPIPTPATARRHAHWAAMALRGHSLPEIANRAPTVTEA